MEKFEEKLQLANKLLRKKQEVEKFIKLIKNSRLTKKETKYRGDNEFSTLTLRSYLYTGYDNPAYECSITDKQIISLISEDIEIKLSSEVNKIKSELENLLN